MNWQRINLTNTMRHPVISPNTSMLTTLRLRLLLNDSTPRFNSTPFIEHGTCLDTEIARMRTTAAAIHDFPVYPSFWRYGSAPTDIKHPRVISRTWIREIVSPCHESQYAKHVDRPFVNSSLYWLTTFEVLDLDAGAVPSAKSQGFFPYRDYIKMSGPNNYKS